MHIQTTLMAMFQMLLLISSSSYSKIETLGQMAHGKLLLVEWHALPII